MTKEERNEIAEACRTFASIYRVLLDESSYTEDSTIAGLRNWLEFSASSLRKLEALEGAPTTLEGVLAMANEEDVIDD